MFWNIGTAIRRTQVCLILHYEASRRDILNINYNDIVIICIMILYCKIRPINNTISRKISILCNY
jgi:hypothetical protein